LRYIFLPFFTGWVYPHTKVAATLVWGYTTGVMKAQRIALVVGGLILAGAVFWTVRTGSLWKNSSQSTVPASIVSTPISGEAKLNSPELKYGYVQASSTASAGVKPGVSVPSLNRPLVIPKSFSPEIALSAKKNIETLIDALKKNSENATLWGELGMERKGIEDYEGAKEAYAYALKLQPNNAIFADNLGVIYGDYLKDYPKAEHYFLLAIKLDPKTEYRYLRALEFYQYALKDIPKAKAILKQGLVAIPGDVSFTTLLETL